MKKNSVFPIFLDQLSAWCNKINKISYTSDEFVGFSLSFIFFKNFIIINVRPYTYPLFVILVFLACLNIYTFFPFFFFFFHEFDKFTWNSFFFFFSFSFFNKSYLYYYVYLLVCLFGGLCPTREFFTHLEKSPLHVKG